MNIVKMSDELKGLIKVPKFKNLYQKQIWMDGRDQGIVKIRNHVRRHSGQALPWMKEAPEKIIYDLGRTDAEIWVQGFNAPIEYISNQIEIAIRNISQNLVMQGTRTIL